MATVEVAAGTPLAESLLVIVQAKLAELGWSSGAADDSALSEYIILMLANSKTQEQIALELANDLLNLGSDDARPMEFARWLFEQVQLQNSQLNGQTSQTANVDSTMDTDATQVENNADDAAMTDDADTTEVPTGPKSMRNGAGIQKNRDRRMLGQVRNAMDRSGEQSMHRIRGAAGSGRINSHNRDPPRGPKNMATSRMINGGGRIGQGMNSANMQNMMQAVTPQQQMALFKMMEEQSRMMAQIFGPGNAPVINPAFQSHQQQSGKSLFDRTSRPNPNGANRGPSRAKGDNMQTDTPADESQRKDSSNVPCRFQLSCTTPDCPYAHQSPAAPPGISIDVNDKCSYGPACQNRKCVASHPSPSQRRQHLGAQVDCKFYPNCTNPSCPFRHPSTPPCRNGADCPTRDSGCTFSHSDVACRYNPCLNSKCPYRHAEGQKRGKYEDKVWTAEGFDREAAEKADRQHVSDRSFVDESGAEELIIPGRMDESSETGANGANAGDAGRGMSEGPPAEIVA